MKKTFASIVFLSFALGTATIETGCHSNAPSNGPTGTTDTTKNGNPTTSDSVLYSFAVFGCNRLSAGDTAGVPSTANLAQLDRTFTDIAALTPRPNFLVVCGDLVLGKGSSSNASTDTTIVGQQLRAWIQHFQSSPVAAAGIQLYVTPGNHETQGETAGVSFPQAEQAWLNNMSQYVAGSNGPGVGGPDHLQTDQSRLSYSINYRDSHILLLNSDPVGADGTVPVNWAASDMAAARTAGQKHIFVIAHKPAYSWDNGTTDGLTISNRDSLWNVFNTNHVEAMITAHNHVYQRLQGTTGSTYMIISGNGGSSLETTAGNYKNFGFVVISVMKSGKVLMKEYARTYGANYNDPSSAATYPTTVRDSADITWP